MKKGNRFIYRKYLKRPMDILLSLMALIILSPIMAIIALLVWFNLGSPIIYKQKRPGLDEKIFTIYKFRTMSDETDENGNLLPVTVRLTNFGRFLRSTSLDELPELFNILKGDMSFVGPRPLALVYLPYYTEEERLRHSVRPGLTGLAAVNGRNSTSWEQRFYFDLTYVKNITFLTDLKIILKTIVVVLKRENVGEHGVDTVVDLDEARKTNRNL